MKDDTNSDPKALHYEEGIPIFNKQLDEVQREQVEAKKRDEQYKDRQIALNSRMVTLTSFLVLGTFVGGGISIYQAHVAKLNADAASANAAAAKDQAAAAKDQVAVLRKQIEEMQRSGVDTHESAIQAKNQADRIQLMAERALDQTKATQDLVSETSRSAEIANSALGIQAAQRQEQEAERQGHAVDDLLRRLSTSPQPCK
jgi:hypothetical protein